MSSLPRPLLVVMLLAVALKLTLVWSGWPENKLIADDAYYYFTIAHHLAHGLGPTFDTLTPTNGFHPLWQGLLVPLFAFDDLWLPIRLAGTLTALLDLLSALILWRWLREASLGVVADWGAALWLWTPLTFLLGLRGLEASLHACLLFACFWLASRPIPPARRLGLLIGLACLARTDSSFVVGLPVAAVILMDGRRALAERVRTLAWSAGIALLLFAPWLLWCQLEFGSVVQVSGRIKNLTTQLVASTPWNFGTWSQTVESILYLLFGFAVKPLRWLAGVEFESSRWWIPVAALWGLAAAVLITIGTRRLWNGATRPIAILVLGCALVHQTIYGAILRSYSVWYALPILGLLLIPIAAAIRPSSGRISWTRVAATIFLGCYVNLAVAYAKNVEHGRRGAEIYWRERLDAVVATVPWAKRLGAWDAGAVGYVATSYPGLIVINLDGLVNNEVLAAVQEGRYAEYILQNVDYLIQHPRRARLFLPPTEMQAFRAEFERVRGLRYPSRRD